MAITREEKKKKSCRAQGGERTASHWVNREKSGGGAYARGGRSIVWVAGRRGGAAIFSEEKKKGWPGFGGRKKMPKHI